MKESISSITNKCLFRETFESETAVRRNGGVPNGGSFLNGKYTNSGTYRIDYIFINKTRPVSLRLKLKFNVLNAGTNYYIFDTRGYGGACYSYIDTSGNIYYYTGTVCYKNASVATTITSAGNYDLIFTLPSDSFTGIRLFERSSVGILSNVTIELFEIYSGTLSASEIALLFQNKSYKPLTGLYPFGGPYGTELMTNSGGVGQTDWVDSNGDGLADGWTAALASTNTIVTGNGFIGNAQKITRTNTMSIEKTNVLVVGFVYELSFKYRTNGGDMVLIGIGSNVSLPVNTGNAVSYTRTGVASQTFVKWYINDLLDKYLEIDEVSVKRVMPKLLLDFDSTQGLIQDRTGLNTLTATSVSIVKDGSITSARFNGTTSKIDCGSDIIGTKNVTVCAWVKLFSGGEASNGIILQNGKYWYYLAWNTKRMSVNSSTSDALSLSNQLERNIYWFVCSTRSSSGVVNHYIGGTNAPSLSGTANQASGTPAAGTTNLIIGNNSAQQYTFDGNIPKIQVYEGILSISELTQIWSTTRKNFL